MSEKPKTYEGSDHIFYSNNSTDDIVRIRPKPGQTLLIDGSVLAPNAEGIDGSVQFNSLGDLAGDGTFLYDTLNNVLEIPHVEANDVKKFKTTNELGYSEIYQGINTSFPQEIVSQFTSTADDFGTDIQMARSTNRFAAACPYLAASEGGISVWSDAVDPDDPWAEYSTLLKYTNFTLDAVTNNSTISEDGTYVFFVDNSQNAWLYAFKLIAGTWTFVEEYRPTIRVKASTMGTNIKLLMADTDSRVFVVTYDTVTDTFGAEETLIDLVTSDFTNYPMAISGNVALFKQGSTSYIFTFNGTTWDAGPTHAATSIQDLACYSSSGVNYTIVFAKGTSLEVWENGVKTLDATPDYTSCTVFSNYLFAYRSGFIDIYTKVLGAWTLSVNSYAITGVTKMSCNSEYLVIAQSGLNTGKLFKIVAYTNGSVEIVSIDLDTASNKLTIDAEYGTLFNDPVEVSTIDIAQANIASGSFSSGTVSLPSVNFLSDTDTGLYYTTNSVNTTVNGVSKLQVSATGISTSDEIYMIAGSAAAPALSFTDDTNSGLCLLGPDSIGVTCGGTTRLEVNSTDINALVPIYMQNGTVGNPALTFDSESNSGLYRIGAGSLGISVQGVNRLSVSTADLITTVPLTIPDGSIAAPSIAFAGYPTDGLFNGGNYVGISVGGEAMFTTDDVHSVSNAPFRELGLATAATPAFSSVAASSSGLFFSGANNVALASGGIIVMNTATEANSVSSVSVGNGCSLVSNNPTLGSVLKVNASGSGKWGQENIVVSGATQFHLFLATSTGVGSITTNGTTTAFNTTSDYRLKENVTPLLNQLDRVGLLNPVSYKWKNHEINGEGFLAHQLAEVFPEAVYGVKDAVDENGKIIPQGFDGSFLIGSLVACIQELKEEIRLIKEELATFV